MMAQSPFDPVAAQDSPSVMPQSQQQPQRAPEAGLAGQWGDWLAKPHNKAALMQFGIAMMQPMGFGETPLSKVGSSLGEAGEASQRVHKQETEDEAADTQNTLREARAGAAETRAGAATTRAQAAQATAEAAGSRAETARMGLESKNEARGVIPAKDRVSLMIQAQKLYNEDLSPNKPKTLKEYLQTQNPDLHRALFPNEGGESPTTPNPAFRQKLAEPGVKGALDRWKEVARSNPNDPRLKAALSSAAQHIADPEAMYAYVGVRP